MLDHTPRQSRTYCPQDIPVGSIHSMDELSAPGVSALRQAQDTIIEHSLDRISSAHDFYRTLPEGSRDQIAAGAPPGA